MKHAKDSIGLAAAVIPVAVRARAGRNNAVPKAGATQMAFIQVSASTNPGSGKAWGWLVWIDGNAASFLEIFEGEQACQVRGEWKG